ncbi:MAG: aspartate--ammonia ligase [Candidatus Aenigmarchaeota archaeon]|nr:aspartate--ammonia ligase [Candidatus Aenigmarchaeota archaeon]
MKDTKYARYESLLGIRETEKEIKIIKDFFQDALASSLALQRVSAPIIVRSGTGVNDDLNGIEHKVSFTIPDDAHAMAEIVFSLAKWKRLALAEYGFMPGEGLYTDMNAIRPDETLDEFHSLYVDQWDWEKIILPGERSLATLKATVRKIYGVIKATEAMVYSRHPQIKPFLPDDISFIHAEELQSMYPHLTPKQREDAIAKEKGAVFVIGIGSELADGKPHDGRAPDYDDWITETGEGKRGLNGDIIVWYPLLAKAMELSSMGIRVDSESLAKQLEIRKAESRMRLRWHSRLLAGELPLTMGGGIGQSRLCMLFLQKLHIGEVQASIWPERISDECARKGVRLL